MTLIKNISPLGDVVVPQLGRVVAAGETVDVSDDLLESFVCQSENWQAVSYAPSSTPTPSVTVDSTATETKLGE